MDGDNGRWWPQARQEIPPWRIADVMYAILGPRLCKEIVEVSQSSAKVSKELASVVSRLEEVNGRRPDALFEIVACLGLAYEHRNCERRSDISRVQQIYHSQMWEMFKMWGYTVELMLQQYGLSPDALELTLRSSTHLTDGPWPPQGVAYVRVDNDAI
jgi:hypothetical protein